MSEGPTNFGKPLLILVILGCAGGGYWLYKNMGASYDGAGWSVKMPPHWKAAIANDPADPTKVTGSGPLPKLPTGEEPTGTCWAKVVYHGTIDWDLYMRTHVPGTPDWTEDVDLDYKKARLFMYEDKEMRYYGAAVDRGDALIFYAVGCLKAQFPTYKPLFEKSARSVRCER